MKWLNLCLLTIYVQVAVVAGENLSLRQQIANGDIQNSRDTTEWCGLVTKLDWRLLLVESVDTVPLHQVDGLEIAKFKRSNRC